VQASSIVASSALILFVIVLGLFIIISIEINWLLTSGLLLRAYWLLVPRRMIRLGSFMAGYLRLTFA